MLNVPLPLTGCVEEAGLVAGVVDPLLTVHGRVGQSGDLVPGGVPVVDVGDVRSVYRAAAHLGAIDTVIHDHCPSLVRC